MVNRNRRSEEKVIIMEFKSILIKDTTKEEREVIVKNSMDCGGGCENCSSAGLAEVRPGISIRTTLTASAR